LEFLRSDEVSRSYGRSKWEWFSGSPVIPSSPEGFKDLHHAESLPFL